MSRYKLIYFNLRGRAEYIRLTFVQAGVEFEDKRIGMEDWPSLKPKTPFGMLPVLEVDGKMLSGSQVIARYVAEKHGLAGQNDFDTAFIASVVDAVSDLLTKVARFMHETDDCKKEEQKRDLQEKSIPDTFGHIEKILAGNKDGWIVGPKPTYGDLGLYATLEQLQEMFPDLKVDKFPKLLQLRQKVESLPRIAKWIKERPETHK